jgi:hypothetical protein
MAVLRRFEEKNQNAFSPRRREEREANQEKQFSILELKSWGS